MVKNKEDIAVLAAGPLTASSAQLRHAQLFADVKYAIGQPVIPASVVPATLPLHKLGNTAHFYVRELCIPSPSLAMEELVAIAGDVPGK